MSFNVSDIERLSDRDRKTLSSPSCGRPHINADFYRALAKSLYAARCRSNSMGKLHGVNAACRAVADTLAEACTSFDRAYFLTACGNVPDSD